PSKFTDKAPLAEEVKDQNPLAQLVEPRHHAPPAKSQSVNKPTRYIPAPIKHAVWLRDQGKCTYIDPITKRICHSKFYLELDHIKPYALNGEHALKNLRLRCRTHNALYAREFFGEKDRSRSKE